MKNNNEDKLKQWRKDYYERNKDRILAQHKKYRQANPERVAQWQFDWRVANEGHTYETPDGYVKYIGVAHPAANPSGVTAYHRIVLWDKLGGKDSPCNWCGKDLFWSKKWTHDALVTDHVNTVKNDNRPENLVPSCHKCNVSREGGQNRVLASESECSVSFCDRRASVKTLCKTHYVQVWSGREPTPIRVHTRSTVTDDGRECNTCLEFKTWENYYVRPNGVAHAHCKVCVGKKAQEARQRRLDKNVECSMTGCTRPVDVKELCTTHYSREWNARKTNNEKSNR